MRLRHHSGHFQLLVAVLPCGDLSLAVLLSRNLHVFCPSGQSIPPPPPPDTGKGSWADPLVVPSGAAGLQGFLSDTTKASMPCCAACCAMHAPDLLLPRDGSPTGALSLLASRYVADERHASALQDWTVKTPQPIECTELARPNAVVFRQGACHSLPRSWPLQPQYLHLPVGHSAIRDWHPAAFCQMHVRHACESCCSHRRRITITGGTRAVLGATCPVQDRQLC